MSVFKTIGDRHVYCRLLGMTKQILYSIAALSLGFVGQSQAATWSFNYSGAGVSASGIITTGSTLTTFGGDSGYFITGISGQRNGVAIAGLTQPANDPTVGYTTSSDGRWWFDNVLLTSGGLDLWGPLFSTVDGKEFNLYNNNGQYIDGYFNTQTGGYQLTNVDLNVSNGEETSRVPDCGATVSMLGLSLVGLAVIRRRFLG
jgi:hypothetical protein